MKALVTLALAVAAVLVIVPDASAGCGLFGRLFGRRQAASHQYSAYQYSSYQAPACGVVSVQPTAQVNPYQAPAYYQAPLYTAPSGFTAPATCSGGSCRR